MFESARAYAVLAGASVLLTVGLFLPGGGSQTAMGADRAVVYMSSGCSCCDYYTDYLKRETGLAVERVVRSDMQRIKEKQGVPDSLRSCHTTVIGDYVVEGHVPVGAIEKLLHEEPSVTGIALPGMPSGSPGMPGQKAGTFRITSFTQDGERSTFMVV